jgi:hypothetical protein
MCLLSARRLLQVLTSSFRRLTSSSGRPADLVQLAAVVAVEEAGGPSVPLALGRADTWSYPPPGRLPDPDASAPMTGAVHAGKLGAPSCCALQL